MKSDKRKKEVDQATKEELEEIRRIFSKQKFITYLSCVFVPPYGLFRIWTVEEDLRRSEKVLWSMIAILCGYYLVSLVLFK